MYNHNNNLQANSEPNPGTYHDVAHKAYRQQHGVVAVGLHSERNSLGVDKLIVPYAAPAADQSDRPERITHDEHGGRDTSRLKHDGTVINGKLAHTPDAPFFARRSKVTNTTCGVTHGQVKVEAAARYVQELLPRPPRCQQ